MKILAAGYRAERRPLNEPQTGHRCRLCSLKPFEDYRWLLIVMTFQEITGKMPEEDHPHRLPGPLSRRFVH